MKSYTFDFTKQTNANLIYKEFFDPSLRGWKMTFEELKYEIESFDNFESWIVNNDLKYERFDPEKHDITGWSGFKYYLKNGLSFLNPQPRIYKCFNKCLFFVHFRFYNIFSYKCPIFI